VVAILSNGGFDGIYEKLPSRLKEIGVGPAVSGRKDLLETPSKA
jgi:hypothetical protein